MSFVRKIIRPLSLLVLFLTVACQTNFQSTAQTKETAVSINSEKPKFAEIESDAIKKLLESAVEQTTLTKKYDPTYVVIPYPNGDVPVEKGVCTDVVIRAFRRAGVDLQRAVHEDMTKNFSVYPKKWNLSKPNTNIDHRRVPNLQTFFTRQGKSLAITDKADDYKPGDVVAWDLDGKGTTHIGLVSNFYDAATKRYLIIHNIGGGTRAEDVIFDWKIIGHFRYF
jgi:uncharacterized protein YijF (DUF1287 family)